MGFGAVVDKGGIIWIIVFFRLKMSTLTCPMEKETKRVGNTY
jgi:hypothetical protein